MKKGFSGDIPSDYFVCIHGYEKSMYKLDFSIRESNLYLYMESENIRGISLHRLEKVADGFGAGIIGRYGYQDTIEFKNLNELIKFIDKMKIQYVGDIYSSRINNGEASNGKSKPEKQ